MARTKGSKNKVSAESKSMPYVFNQYQNLVFAPKVINNSPIALIQLNKGFVGICNSKNASSLASTPLRLFAVKNNKNTKFLYPTRELSKKQIENIQLESHSMVVKNAQNIVEIVDHPVFECLNNVNGDGDLNYYDLMEITAGYLGLVGNSYWQIIKNNGTPIGINVLPSEFTSVQLDSELKIAGYSVTHAPNNSVNYEAEDVIHFLNIAPGVFWKFANRNTRTGLYGMGDLEYILDEVYLYNSINDYLRSLTENNAIPAGIVKYKNGRLDKNTMEDVQKQWNKVLRGWKNAGKTKIMDQDFEWLPLSIAPKDLDFPEGRKFLMNVIANGFGIPIDLLTTENSNKASSSTAIHNYMRFTIKPKLRRIEERLNSHLMPMFDDKLFLKFDECVPADQQLAMQQENNDLKNGVITVNEVRALRGLQPVAWGNLPYIPAKEEIDINGKKPKEEIDKEE